MHLESLPFDLRSMIPDLINFFNFRSIRIRLSGMIVLMKHSSGTCVKFRVKFKAKYINLKFWLESVERFHSNILWLKNYSKGINSPKTISTFCLKSTKVELILSFPDVKWDCYFYVSNKYQYFYTQAIFTDEFSSSSILMPKKFPPREEFFCLTIALTSKTFLFLTYWTKMHRKESSK